MAEEAKKIGAILVHYSTDYVFDGAKRAPYLEDDLPNPQSAYGRTKLAGERAIQESGVDTSDTSNGMGLHAEGSERISY